MKETIISVYSVYQGQNIYCTVW